jgi:hypothetical protein
LNTLLEQDHRFLNRLVNPGLGFFSFETAGRTLQGDEVLHLIRQGQIRGVGKGDSTGQGTFSARLLGVAASAQQERGTACHCVLRRGCATQPSIVS